MIEEEAVESLVAAEGKVEDLLGRSEVVLLLGDLVEMVEEVDRVAELVVEFLTKRKEKLRLGYGFANLGWGEGNGGGWGGERRVKRK